MQLTRNETLYLYDAISIHDPIVGRDGDYPDLLLKLGDALISTKGGTETKVEFTLRELWAIREHAKSSVTLGGEQVGINLIYKLAPLISKLMRGYDLREIQEILKEIEDANDNPSADNTDDRAQSAAC